jgi:hypothetical protein
MRFVAKREFCGARRYAMYPGQSAGLDRKLFSILKSSFDFANTSSRFTPPLHRSAIKVSRRIRSDRYFGD